MFIACIKFHKQFRQWYLLERGSADDLQDFIHRGREILLLLGDGDEKVGAQCGPDLDPHAVRCPCFEANGPVLLNGGRRRGSRAARRPAGRPR